MNIQFFDATKLQIPTILQVHKSGRLGFTKQAANMMGLEYYHFVGIGTNSEDKKDTSLYMVLYKEHESHSFPIKLNDGYYSAAIKPVLDLLKVDYTTGKVRFELIKLMDGNNVFYKLSLTNRSRVNL